MTGDGEDTGDNAGTRDNRARGNGAGDNRPGDNIAARGGADDPVQWIDRVAGIGGSGGIDGIAGHGPGRPLPSATPGWSAAALAALVRLWDEGLTAPEVAARLGKTTRAVECKVHKLRAAGHRLAARRRGRETGRARRARRRCLYCGGSFLSSHPGNRLCAVCLADGPFTSALV